MDQPISVGVWEKISGALEKVVPEKESPEGMLNTTTHFNQVTQDVLTRTLM